MNILMMTNTYTPLLGGLEQSVKRFTQAYRLRGHRTIVVAPTFKGMPARERDVLRVPAIQNFSGTDFSVRLPIPGLLAKAVPVRPDIVHAHHPFLMGDTALRLVARQNVPLVFTHHTLFEQYTHYLPMPSKAAERFMTELATSYANLCDHVFVPSDSVARLLRARGVVAPIDVVPTGVSLANFRQGDRSRVRADWGIPPSAVVVGHLGRLAPEKNLDFLTAAVVAFLKTHPRAHFVVIGAGPSEPEMRRACARAGAGPRAHFVGPLKGLDVVDAYHAMDMFVFASKSETQGLVLIEAMAAGLPVVAVDAPGVREVVRDAVNGRLLPEEDVRLFAEALDWVAGLPPERLQVVRLAARATARSFTMPRCAARALELYEAIRRRSGRRARRDERAWTRAARRLQTEWELIKKTAKATKALVEPRGKVRRLLLRRREEATSHS